MIYRGFLDLLIFAYIIAWGDRRNRQAYGSTNLMDPDANITGIRAEHAMSRILAAPMCWVDRPGGDGGADLIVPGIGVVDVKGTKGAAYLKVDERKLFADVYILVECKRPRDPECPAVPIGWATREMVQNAEKRPFGSSISHHIHRSQLRLMDELYAQCIEVEVTEDSWWTRTMELLAISVAKPTKRKEHR